MDSFFKRNNLGEYIDISGKYYNKLIASFASFKALALSNSYTKIQ
jgi:hypothetical protein